MSVDSFYKYCPVYQDEDFTKEWSVVNLIEGNVKFSTRRDFNDLFDSKVNALLPTKSQLKSIAARLPTAKRIKFREIFMGDDWRARVELFRQEMEKKLDDYLYYCVTTQNDNNLMWSHYASSHSGFCIEWDAKAIAAEPIIYDKEIGCFELQNLIEIHCGLASSEEVGKQLWQALRTKLKEWEYESEYRFQMSELMSDLISERYDKYSLVRFDPSWIRSIIWGCRTSEKTKTYIRENLPYRVNFKQAYEMQSSLGVRNEYL